MAANSAFIGCFAAGSGKKFVLHWSRPIFQISKWTKSNTFLLKYKNSNQSAYNFAFERLTFFAQATAEAGQKRILNPGPTKYLS